MTVYWWVCSKCKVVRAMGSEEDKTLGRKKDRICGLISTESNMFGCTGVLNYFGTIDWNKIQELFP